MKSVTFADVLALKKAVQERFGAQIHFHDRCSYSAFSLDAPNAAVRSFIETHFAAQGLRAVFNDAGTDFVLE